jgi:hypothetical protein
MRCPRLPLCQPAHVVAERATSKANHNLSMNAYFGPRSVRHAGTYCIQKRREHSEDMVHLGSLEVSESNYLMPPATRHRLRSVLRRHLPGSSSTSRCSTRVEWGQLRWTSTCWWGRVIGFPINTQCRGVQVDCTNNNEKPQLSEMRSMKLRSLLNDMGYSSSISRQLTLSHYTHKALCRNR